MSELAKLTWQEARERFHARSVALLPIGATEPHGPHLPLDTDVTIARAQSLRAAERLGEEGVAALVLPPLSYGLTHYTDGFEGRVTLRPGTLWNLLEDVVESEPDCNGTTSTMQGKVTVSGTKTIQGIYGGGADDPIVPTRWDPAVLEFDPAEHSATDRYQWFSAQQRAAGGDERTIYRSRVGAGGASLDPILRTILRRRHGALLRELGYEA